ncbi:DUF1294 domain-containing protein [Cupriavidus lacunae]|uniref:DUF1294 domain-containing protein n=2 Tax=Cupriavidus lacunae TaxID=2666307 RepID=A0A370NK61_9BURK|nr:DUF1294 domain-containing protein [Cupriavidus lacunae]
MRKAGRVKSWHADKGYGFINVHADVKDIFFHVTALQNRSAPPATGDRVMFELATSKDGRVQAVNVAILGTEKHAQPKQPAANAALLLFALAALAGIVGAAFIGYLPREFGTASLLMSVLAFATYYVDKTRANRNAWRISEARLHLIALCGGWPGALAAQQLLRHKNRKQEFQVTFWITVVLNVGAVVLWKTIMTA